MRAAVHEEREASVNLAVVDLNLLVAFDALMTERHVTRAGQRIGLSQPAMSAALNRLRLLTQDKLFERRGDGMHPTPRALALAGPLRQALLQIQVALNPQPFDPTRATHTFRIALNDLGVALFLPPISERLSAWSDTIDFVFLPAEDKRALDLLESGEADIAIGPNWNRYDDQFETAVLYQAPFACAMRKDHPLAETPLTLETFASVPQIMISQPGDPSRHIDRELSEHGLRRRVAFTVPHYLTVPILLAKTDLLSVIPGKLIQRFGVSEGIRAVDTPFTELSVPVMMSWVRAANDEPANIWLRSLIVEIVRDHKLDRWSADGPEAGVVPD
jgi:DNA-binding transcriptional LysR family regulator